MFAVSWHQDPLARFIAIDYYRAMVAKTPIICLLIVTVLPYVWTAFQAYGRMREFGSLDNRYPRLQQARLTGLGARALGAHNNSFEALMVFAPAVILAMWTGADQTWVARLSVVYVVARLCHGIAYLTDQDKLRTAFFAVGMLSVISLWTLILHAAL
ncbi:MAG: MAPEG family protein [Proteobacteria bacterium]|nr:MAPEG family protein [Pseudomonadota bacterium]